MMDRKRGWIVNFGSVGGLRGRADGAIYGAAKAAVHHYTRCLADQLRPYNIPVNCIAPGGTVTPRFLATRQADESKLGLTGTLDRYAEPEETARAVAFLVSDPGPSSAVRSSGSTVAPSSGRRDRARGASTASARS